MFLNLLYDFLKIVIKFILWIFYPTTTFFNKKGLEFDKPTIVVSNHPNTLLDAVGVAARVKKRVFFLANAGLFANPIAGWLLNHLYCIPIMRKKDAEKKKVNNNESFRRSFEHFAKGGSMYIAPEGSSFMERRLRPVKSGTARIALGAEAANDWSLGLNILPIGLTYANPNKFGSRMVFNVGAPIVISDFRKDYEKDPQKTWVRITELLENRMKALITDTLNDEEDELLQKLEEMDLSDGHTPEQVFSNTQNRTPHLRALSEEQYKSLIQLVNNYFNHLNSIKSSDKAIVLSRNNTLGGNLLWRAVVLLIGLPIFIYGALNHLFAFGIPALLTKVLKLYIGYESTVKTITGMITFPLFYILQTKWIIHYFGTNIGWGYLLTLPVLGILAWNYSRFFKLTKELFNFSRKDKQTAWKMRDDIRINQPEQQPLSN